MPIHGYPGNIITANPTAPTVSSASGVWTTEQQLINQSAGNWPMAQTQVSLSARFNSADSAYLSRTPTTAGNRKTWTWSGWVKVSSFPATNLQLFGTDFTSVSNNSVYLTFASQTLALVGANSGVTHTVLVSSALYRDPSAWYHIVASVDTTQATASNRAKLYVNGVQVTALSTATYPAQNTDTSVNNTVVHSLGALRIDGSFAQFLNGYLAEVNFIDGLALTPAYFGFNDSNTGAWTPKQYTGAYGTNGFFLPFNIEAVNFSADYLVIAGGGGGGAPGPGGGGGAGGYREFTSQTLTTGTSYTVTVGAGGAGGSKSGSVNGASGSNSVFSSITSAGGGGGARSNVNGTAGGSGGGGSNESGNGGAGNTPSTSPSQGNNGGGNAPGTGVAGSGGGGAGAVGSNANQTGSTRDGAAGGTGTASSITGTSVTRAGGGGGGARGDGGSTSTGGAGGTGGGGAGGNAAGSGGSGATAPTAGTDNTGGGGGGGPYNYDGTRPYDGGNGGSGVVIIKIPDSRTANFSSGVTSSLSTAVSGYKIYTVTATSTTSETVTFS